MRWLYKMDVNFVVIFLAFLALSECQENEEEVEVELHPLDGWFNNLIHPDWGAVDTILLRKSPTAYTDGVYLMAGTNRPNPFEISKVALRGPMGFGSQRGRNAMQVYFGQQVVEEIMDAQRPGCPREFENIDIPVDHDLYNPDGRDNLQMPFLRSRYDFRTGQSPSNPRQQLNEITPYLDGQLMYGPAKAWTDAIREFRGGRLLALNNEPFPIETSLPGINDIRLPFANPPNPRELNLARLRPVSRFWRLGNPRAFENPFLLSFGVLWFRWHNYLAMEIANERGFTSDEDQVTYDELIFNEARKKVTAHHQKIVMYDWLPRWLLTPSTFNSTRTENFYPINITSTDPSQPTCPYTGYDPNIHPGITHEFQTSAMRFGHTLVTPGIWRRDPKQAGGPQENCAWIQSTVDHVGFQGQTHALRLCNAYWNSQEAVVENIDSLYRGMASTLSEREDHIMVEDLAGASYKVHVSSPNTVFFLSNHIVTASEVFGPMEFSRRDLGAINIQRARDHGLPDYQLVRETFELPRLTSWRQINDGLDSIPETVAAVENLRLLYAGKGFNASVPNDVDMFVGGLMETKFDGPGELFRAILVEQFCRIRDGDRFWYENMDNGLFTYEQIQEINMNITLGYIIARISNVRVRGQRNVPDNEAEVQSDVFVHRGSVAIDGLEDPCTQPFQLNLNTIRVVPDSDTNDNLLLIENCTAIQNFDYFFGVGSEISFPLTFVWLGLCIPITIAIMLLMAKRRMKKMEQAKKKPARVEKTEDPNTFLLVEWVGRKDGERNVKVNLDSHRKKIHISDRRGKPLRMIDLRSKENRPAKSVYVWDCVDKSQTVVSIRAEGEIDLVLKFGDVPSKNQFLTQLKSFLEGIGTKLDRTNQKEDIIYNQARTKEDRQKLLDKFFRVVCLQAFKTTTTQQLQLENLDQDTAKQIAQIQLTRTEFAEALGLKPTSIFVRNMFLLVDSDRSGFVSFREFLDFFVVLSSDDAESKVHLIFNMYDIQRRGVLTKKDFASMIQSLLDLSDSSLEKQKLQELISSMYRTANVPDGADMNFDAFKKVFASDEYSGTLQKATLNLDAVGDMGGHGKGAGNGTLKGRRATMMKAYSMKGKSFDKKTRDTVHFTAKATEYPRTPFAQKWFDFTSFVSTFRLQIFWITLFTLVLFGIFLERAHYYSFEREHAGLRRIAGYGVTITRGAASAMMFTYCSLLITMSRNVITFFRETFLHRFFPWDSMHLLHKYIAYWALFFTFVHAIGHAFNLYHISTQNSGDLNCIFREYFRATDILASFHYWTYTTITGITGLVLTVIVIIMYVFASPYARRYAFNAFWATHSLYIFLYIFMLLHGMARLVQPPITHTYLIGPLVIFVIDKIFSVSRKKIVCRVSKAELLPSDVTALVFERPNTFEYKSGQWVRIACLDLGENEYHPFTLTSAPHEEYLSLHIRAVGPWTWNLRNLYEPDNLESKQQYPKVYVDGPYGEGHQDWYRYDVAILVGGGIGVTPFASILKDIVHKSKIADLRFPCKKVYFIWVTRTQKQFEWMTDIIQEVENVDTSHFVDTHIFITQFQEKFDLRTTMLYICERHFQKVAGKSLFTGLSAVTHFGRPQFVDLLRTIKHEHPKVNRFGVFSCGPPPMTNGLDRSCTALNKEEGATFYHHFENF